MYLLVIFFSRQGGKKEMEIEQEREALLITASSKIDTSVFEHLAFPPCFPLSLSPYIYSSAVLDGIEDGA